MGEPMLNYDAVMTAIQILSEPCGMAIPPKPSRSARSVSSLASDVYPRSVPGTVDRLANLGGPTAPPGAVAGGAEVLQRGVNRCAPRVSHRQRTTGYSGLDDDLRRERGQSRCGAISSADARLPIKLDLIDVNDPSGCFRPPTRLNWAPFAMRSG